MKQSIIKTNHRNLLNTRNLFITILIISIFLRLINITSEQIWADEGISIHIAKSSWEDFWPSVIKDIHPPLYYLLLKIWIIPFGDSIFSCRMLSVIFSVLTLPIFFLIGKEIKNEKLGLITIFFYSISPFSIYYSNEIRSYSLILLLFSICLYISMKIMKEPENKKHFMIFIIFGALSIYTHYIGIVYFVILVIAILFYNSKNRNVFKNLIISGIFLIIIYIPWIPFAISDLIGGAPGYAGGRLSVVNLIYYAFNYFLAPVPSDINDPYVFNLIIITFIINLPLIIISLFSLIGFLFLYKSEDFQLIKLKIYFLIMITFLLFGISIVNGVIFENTFTAKNLIGGLSITIPLQSVGLYYLLKCKENIFNNRLKFILNFKTLNKTIYPLFFILIMSHIVIYPILRANYLQKPDWEGCVKKLKTECKDDDILIMAYDGGRYTYPMEYYSEKHNFDLEDHFYDLDYEENNIREFFDEILKKNITRIWIVSFWEKIRDPNDKTKDLIVDEYNLEEKHKYKFRLDIELILYEIIL